MSRRPKSEEKRPPRIPLGESELIRARQRDRARIMAWLLGAFVVLLFLITLAKIGMGR